MFLSEAEAEARLGELRRRRDHLDRLIADHLLYLELGRRLPEPAASEGFPTPPERSPQPGATDLAHAAQDDTAGPTEAASRSEDKAEARRRGRAMVAAALAVLREAGRPLHASRILEGLDARGFTVPGADPVAALNTRLWKRSGPGGPLLRLGDAVYAPADPGSEEARAGLDTEAGLTASRS